MTKPVKYDKVSPRLLDNFIHKSDHFQLIKTTIHTAINLELTATDNKETYTSTCGVDGAWAVTQKMILCTIKQAIRTQYKNYLLDNQGEEKKKNKKHFCHILSLSL